MKPNRSNPLSRHLFTGSTLTASLIITLTAVIQPAARAANLTWDANGVTTDVTNGAGTWDTSSINWWDGATNVAWTDGNTAVIGSNPLSGAGGIINFADAVDISALGLVVADNANTTNHTLASPLTGAMAFTIGTGGITANDGITISQPFFMGGNQSWTRSATGNGALTITGSVDDNFIPRALSLSSALGSGTVGIVLRGALFHDGTTAIGDGYFQVRHDSFGLSAITLNGTIGGAQRIQFINSAGTGVSGTLGNAISLGNGKEGNFYVWGGFTTNVTLPITGGDATSVLRKSDSGTLVFEGDNTYTGATIVDTGTLQLGTGGTAGAINPSASLAINGSAIVDIRRSGNTNLSDLFPGGADFLSTTFGAAAARLNFSGPSQSDTLTIDQDLGNNTSNGQLRVTTGTMSLVSGADLTLNTISVGHTTGSSGNVGTLNVGTGVNVTLSTTTTAALNLGDSSGNAGIMNMTGGNVTTASNATGSIRVGHWTGTGSSLNISGGTLSTPSGRLAIGWDGEGTLNMTGGTINAFAVSIDGNTSGPPSVANLNGGDLRIGGNGMNTLGQGSINANGGKITATAANTLNVPRTILAGGLSTAFGSATANITITDNCVTTGSGPLTILNDSATGEKNYTINTSSPTYSGAVSVPNGVRLQLQQPNALGTGTATIVSGSGAFLTSSTSAYPTNFSLSGNGWLEPSSTLAYGALRLQTATVSGNVAIAAGGARITAHSGSNGTITGNLTGSGALEINSTQASNNGTITLAGNGSGYSGAITVPQGRLNVSGSVGGNVSAIDGATLGGEGTIGGNLVLGGTTPATLNIDPNSAAALAVTGNVTLTGANAVSFTPSPTTVGAPIKVFSYSGTLTGTPGTDLVLASSSSYRSASWSNVGGVVSLTISNKNLAWTGSAGGNWDVGITASWTDGSPSTFYWADNITFPDGPTNNTISVASTEVAPASMTVSANTTPYTFTSVANAQVETATAAGSSTADGNVSVTVTAVDLPGSPLTLPVAITTGQAATTWAGTVRTALTNNVDINARFIVGGSGATITLTRRPNASGVLPADDATLNIALQNGTPAPGITSALTSANTTAGVATLRIAGNGTLLKSGTGVLTMIGANNYSGGTTLVKGETRLRTAGTLGTGTVTLGSAATGADSNALYIETNRVTFTTPLVVSNNGSGTVTLGTKSTVTGSGAGNGFTGITLARDVIFDSNAADRTDYASISGTGNITVSGAGRSVLSNANTFVGNITIKSITDANGLQLGTNSTAFNAIPDTSNVTIEAGGKLSVSYTAGGTETINGLSGDGIVRNNGGNANTLIVGSGNASTTFAGTIVNGGAAAFGFTKSGTGTQTLSGVSNSYTGVTTISAGVLEAAALANGGTNSSIGAATNAATNLVFGSATATLRYTGSANITTDRGFTLSSGTSNAGATLESSGTGAWTIPAAVAIGYGTVDQARALTLGGTGTGANTFAGTIANNGTGLTTLNKTGAGTWALTSNNSFTGPLNINGGRLNLSFIGNGAAASQVGQSTKAGTNLVLNGGTLAYTGITAATDRAFSTGASGGSIEVPTGITLTFGSASSVFALGGTLTKTGAGTLSLANYTGSSAAAASDLVINDGVVNFGTGYFNASPFGFRTLAITVNPSGILRLSAGHSLGGDNIEAGTSLGQIRLSGGEMQLNGSQYLSSGLVSGQGRLVLEGGKVTGSSDFRSVPSGTVITSLASATTSAIQNTGGISLQFGSLTFDVEDGTASTDLSFTGPITSTNGFTKSGAGLLSLTGASTYAGATNLNAGTIQLGGSMRGTSAITVAAGTTLEVTSTNPFTTGHAAAEVATQAIQVNGGTLRFTSTSEARLGNIGLNGATLTSNRGSGFGAGYDIYLGALDNAAEATVSVTGTTASTINGSGFLRLGTNTVFDVADADVAGDDLTVSIGFRDQTLDQTNAPGGFTKTGDGTMTLSGVSGHTGNTTVNGGLLKLANSGSLRFAPGANGVSNKVTGSGAAQFSGAFEIVLTGADTTIGNSWVLADVTTRSFTSSFSVTGFADPENDGTWVLNSSGRTWTFSESTGILTVAAGSGYGSWIDGFFPGETNPAIIGATADPDNDGIANAVEFVLGGDPKNTMDAALKPTITLVTNPSGLPAGNYMKYTFRRTDTSVSAGLVATATYDTDLVPAWTPAVQGIGGVQIVTTDEGFATGVDKVEVYVPRLTNTLFGRLDVLVP